MRTTEYTGRYDLRAMQELTARTWHPGARWHVGDLAWQRFSVPSPGEDAGWLDGVRGDWPTRLWWNGPQVQAWGWCEQPETLGLCVDPLKVDLAEEVLGWFASVASADVLEVTVSDAEPHLSQALREAGYQPSSDGPWFAHCLATLEHLPPESDLPSGIQAGPVRPEEAPARAALHRAAWRPTRVDRLRSAPAGLAAELESRVSAKGYDAVMCTWPYRCETDIVLRTNDGEMVGGALGWLDETNAVGELEPVGTDPHWGRRGLGRAASLAAMHALAAAGARRCVVCPRGDADYPVPLRMYRALGFEPVARSVTWSLQR